MGCNKDPILPDTAPDCKSYRPGKIDINFIKKVQPSRKWATFLPQNSDEFAYVITNGVQGSIRIKNLVTRLDSAWLESVLYPQKLAMNELGNLLFTNIHNQVHLLNKGLNTAQQLTNSGIYFSPLWESDSTFLCQYSVKGGNPYIFLRIDLNGEILDTLNNVQCYTGDYNARETKLVSIPYSGHKQLYVYALNEPSSILKKLKIKSSLGYEYLSCAKFNQKLNRIYVSTTQSGLYKLNIETGKAVQILDGCRLSKITEFTISDDGTKMILGRQDTFGPFENGVFKETNKLFLYDINSGKLSLIPF